MKKIFTLLAFIFSIAGQAQTTTGQVRGTVTDNSQKQVESVTVTLLHAKDSAAVKFAISDKAGFFSFEDVKSGKYLVSVSALGHKKSFSPVFELTDANPALVLQPLVLLPIDKTMGAVTVTAKKPLFEQKIDRMIVNVEASVTNVGSTALEVLEKSPGIMVDKDGNISLKGKQGVMVMVDGRPTQLGGADLANLLRSMNASQLDQIEIMTNPPAKYDAAGNAGIINIKTKKNRQFGYNGSVTLGYSQGVYPKFNEGLNMNYRQGKLNFFANLSHNYREGFGKLNLQRNFLDGASKQVLSRFDQEARMSNENNSFNAKLGMDYFAGKNTSFGLVLTGFSNPGNFGNRNINRIYNPSGQLVEQTKALSVQDRTWKNFSTNLNFRHVLDSAGKEITADLDYMSYDGNQNQLLTNSYFDAFGHTKRKADTLYGKLPQAIDIYSARVDYLQPLKKGARFEAGLKSSFVKTDNNAIYDTAHYGQVIRDQNRSNYFLYEENINAAYVNLSGNISKKLSGQFGLRVENTNAKGRQLTTGQDFDRHYTQLFPTAFVQYKADDKNNLGLNYGRRIRRPNYESLNPFIEFLDRYTFQQGNPNLKPQFSHNIELSHTYKNIVTTTLNYSKTTDIIQQVIDQIAEDTLTFIKQQNIANQRQYGIAVSVGMPLTKWWTTNLYINAFNNHFKGLVNNENVSISATTFTLNGSQQFKLNKNLSAELSGWYRGAGIEGVLKVRPTGIVAFGFSQQVMKGKGTLRLNVRDIFYTQRFKASSKYGAVDAAFQERRDSRVLNLGFSYRFSKGKMGNGPKRRASSANDEQSRVGGGS
ncbi:MAG TPA: outer membrane beta-barrel family protein [Flavisolibacter sp.]|nr:outer membrane beta-barrel family protein [Flavisolibacter sp.]